MINYQLNQIQSESKITLDLPLVINYTRAFFPKVKSTIARIAKQTRVKMKFIKRAENPEDI